MTHITDELTEMGSAYAAHMALDPMPAPALTTDDLLEIAYAQMSEAAIKDGVTPTTIVRLLLQTASEVAAQYPTVVGKDLKWIAFQAFGAAQDLLLPPPPKHQPSAAWLEHFGEDHEKEQPA